MAQALHMQLINERKKLCYSQLQQLCFLLETKSFDRFIIVFSFLLYVLYNVQCTVHYKESFKYFFLPLQPTETWGLITLFIQHCSVIFRPSDHTVGRPQAEIRTRDGRFRGRDSNHQTTTPLYGAGWLCYFSLGMHSQKNQNRKN